MKVALVHDYLNQIGGGERVLKVFSKIFPEASIYALFGKEEVVKSLGLEGRATFSFLNKLPAINNHHRLFIPFYPLGVAALKIGEADLVISNSSNFTKGVKTKAFHLNYCLTPTRYLWEDSYIKNHPYSRILKLPAYLLKPLLRKIDKKFSERPNLLLADSVFISRKIKEYYRRDSFVLYPPYDEKAFFYDRDLKKEDYYLMVGRLLFYKKFDLVIRAFNLSGKNLLIVGDGPEMARLKKMARSSKIKFLGRAEDGALRKYYAKAKALIFPQVEDFGLVPVEAMASGTPVIAFRGGGAMESVKENFSGIFFDSQTEESVNSAVKRFERMDFDFESIARDAKRFSEESFTRKFKEILREYGPFHL